MQKHLRDVQKTTQMRQNHHNITIPGLTLHHGNTESRKNLEQKSSFNQVHSILTESMNASHSINLFTNSCHHISTNGKVPPHPHKNQHHHNSSIRSDERLTLETSAFQVFHGGNSTFINTFHKTKFPCFIFPPTVHHSFFRN